MTGLPLVGDEYAGYRVRSVLGRGGMSVVYQAENLRLSSVIALKVLAPELAADDVFRARFLEESRIAASLNHPNVIPIYDMGSQDGLLYIAMRYVSGTDLRQMIKKRGRILPATALFLLGQAARALDAAHRHGLVHRDVKPGNLLIERGDQGDPDHVYLADFGITKHAMSRSGLTSTGQFLGTIDYVAPEQIRGTSVLGLADQYSLGCVLYECLTGRVPFEKDLDAAIIWAHVEETPTMPTVLRPELPPEVDEVFRRVLSKHPDERYGSCREFVDAAGIALGIIGPGTGSALAHGTMTTGPRTGPPSGGQAATPPDQFSWSDMASRVHPAGPAVDPAAAASGAVGQSGSSQPSADQAGYGQPGYGQPGTGRPGAGQSGGTRTSHRRDYGVAGPGEPGQPAGAPPDHGGPRGPRWYRQPRWIAALAAVVVLLAGLGIWAGLSASGSHGGTAAPSTSGKPVAQPGWEQGSDSLYATQQVGAAVDGSGRIWVAGGLADAQNATAKTEFYDPATRRWRSGPNLPFPLHHAMMVSYQDTVWVIGGFQPRGSEIYGVASARALHLNQTLTAWVEAPELHHARGAAAAAVVGNQIVVVGGRTAGTSPAEVIPTEVFDGISWHDAAGIPVPGDHLAAASDGRYVYAVGGRRLEVTSNTAAVQRFDPAANRWIQLSAAPGKVSDAGAAIVGGRLIVAGGESIGTVFSTVWAYDLASSTWTTLPKLAAPRHGLGVAAIGSTLYAIDGASQPGHNASTRTVQTLAVPRGPAQPAGGWQQGSDSLYATQQVGAAVDRSGRIWVAGGLTDAQNATAKTEFYDPTIGTWSTGPNLPFPLHHAMMVSYQDTVWVIGGFPGAASEPGRNGLGPGPPAAPCAWRWRGGGGGEPDRRGRRADSGQLPAGGRDHRGFRRHRLARCRRHSGSGGSPGGRVGREVPVRRRRAQARGHL
jgi:predicted Ser/Thr protein kinase